MLVTFISIKFQTSGKFCRIQWQLVSRKGLQH